jgi:very-short-patch-repair endonuclease
LTSKTPNAKRDDRLVDVASLCQQLGGVAPTHELLARGCSRSHLSLLVRRGELVRVRQGWYASPDLATDVQRAVRVGGVLGCVSALHLRGLATIEPVQPHVCVTHGTARLRNPDDHRRRRSAEDDATVHWSRRPSSGARALQSVPDAVLAMAFCQTVERTVAAVDSALRTEVLSQSEWAGILTGLPTGLAAALAVADGRSESFIESIARCRLLGLGYRPALQVPIAGVGRVDMMLGPRLVLEFDGWAYHGDVEQFERDRRRDAQLAARQLRSLRFSYRQVMHRWHEVRSAIAGALA